jgi:hypothetical protein
VGVNTAVLVPSPACPNALAPARRSGQSDARGTTTVRAQARVALRKEYAAAVLRIRSNAPELGKLPHPSSMPGCRKPPTHNCDLRLLRLPPSLKRFHPQLWVPSRHRRPHRSLRRRDMPAPNSRRKEALIRDMVLHKGNGYGASLTPAEQPLLSSSMQICGTHFARLRGRH